MSKKAGQRLLARRQPRVLSGFCAFEGWTLSYLFVDFLCGRRNPGVRGGAGWVASGSEGVDPWRRGSLPLGNGLGAIPGENGERRSRTAGGDELRGLRGSGGPAGAGAPPGAP